MGLLQGCRLVISLDTCFMKGPFGGQLMQTVARDGNNQMFPTAMAVVDSECKDNWGWYLHIILGRLDIQEKNDGCLSLTDKRYILIK